jgi:hypothetical protein
VLLIATCFGIFGHIRVIQKIYELFGRLIAAFKFCNNTISCHFYIKGTSAQPYCTCTGGLILGSCIYSSCGPGSSVGIATELRAGRSGDRIPVGGARFSARPDRPWGPPSLLYIGYRVFPGGKVEPERAADHSHPSSAAVMEE